MNTLCNDYLTTGLLVLGLKCCTR